MPRRLVQCCDYYQVSHGLINLGTTHLRCSARTIVSLPIFGNMFVNLPIISPDINHYIPGKKIQTHVAISSSVGALAPPLRPVISFTHSPIACRAPPVPVVLALVAVSGGSLTAAPFRSGVDGISGLCCR